MSLTSDPGRWAALCAAFDTLVEMDPGVRSERLADIGGSDPASRRALEELLEADTNAAAWLAPIDAIFGTADPLPAAEPSAGGDLLTLVGRTIGHFRVVEPLAAGGMGAVYRALDTQIGRSVALKFPLPGERLDHELRARFVREARVVGALDHPNICGIYEAGQTDDGQLYLAMPLYEGETLKTRIAREGRLPVTDALSFARQIARGLHAAHRAGIVHRDLKPANVIILPDGAIKLLDFGIARVSDDTLTGAHAMLGTVPYMAPEQVRGEAVAARVDLWAMGVVIYEMLTGRRPFEGEHDIAVAHAIVHSDPIRPSAFRPEIGPELDALVLRLLAKKPGKRHASAEVVATALATLESRRGRRGVRRWRLPVPASFGRGWGSAATVALILTGSGTTAWLVRTRYTAATEPRVVAVLPFREAGGRDVYLGLALADEIATRLSRLSAVGVPTERTALDYRGSDKPSLEIAGELGAAAVVRGSVHRAGDQVRLEIEIFDGRQNRLLWTENYIAPARSLLALQSGAMESIARALSLDLTDGERAAMRQLSTASPEAYDLYLRGRADQIAAGTDDHNYQGLQPSAVEHLQRAESSFARAREVDPDFAAARARLAMAHLALAPYGQTDARRDQGRVEAEAALRLRPGLPEAHEALASYWLLRSEPVNAIGELERALAGRPNAPHLHMRLGFALHLAGRREEALLAYERAIRLDPVNTAVRYSAGTTYTRLRRYEDAIAHWDRVIAMDTAGDPYPRVIRAYSYLRLGNLDSMDAAIARIPLAPDPGGITTNARYTAHRFMGRDVEALASLDSARLPITEDGLLYLPVSLMRAQALERLGDKAGARSNYESARSLLEDSVAAHPRDARMRVALGLAYAGLNRRADALREALAATEIVPVAESSSGATAYMGGALEIYARLGEADKAFELIELLLAMPAGRELSVPLLRLDPTFDKLRGRPQFDSLIARFSPN